MIKFFRKIRYDLMEQNKTGKYLKYAIGEIVLVVIGILIALSINNWNEQRKDLKTVSRLFQNLESSLKTDSLALSDIIFRSHNSLTKMKIVLSESSEHILQEYDKRKQLISQ